MDRTHELVTLKEAAQDVIRFLCRLPIDNYDLTRYKKSDGLFAEPINLFNSNIHNCIAQGCEVIIPCKINISRILHL